MLKIPSDRNGVELDELNVKHWTDYQVLIDLDQTDHWVLNKMMMPEYDGWTD